MLRNVRPTENREQKLLSEKIVLRNGALNTGLQKSSLIF